MYYFEGLDDILIVMMIIKDVVGIELVFGEVVCLLIVIKLGIKGNGIVLEKWVLSKMFWCVSCEMKYEIVLDYVGIFIVVMDEIKGLIV